MIRLILLAVTLALLAPVTSTFAQGATKVRARTSFTNVEELFNGATARIAKAPTKELDQVLYRTYGQPTPGNDKVLSKRVQLREWQKMQHLLVLPYLKWPDLRFRDGKGFFNKKSRFGMQEFLISWRNEVEPDLKSLKRYQASILAAMDKYKPHESIVFVADASEQKELWNLVWHQYFVEELICLQEKVAEGKKDLYQDSYDGDRYTGLYDFTAFPNVNQYLEGWYQYSLAYHQALRDETEPPDKFYADTFKKFRSAVKRSKHKRLTKAVAHWGQLIESHVKGQSSQAAKNSAEARRKAEEAFKRGRAFLDGKSQ